MIMPTIADWLMVGITAVYVIATILICIANMKSAKATREQIDESKRQFEAINRPRVVVELIYERRLWFGLRFVNNGNRIANNVRVEISQKFIDSLPEQKIQTVLNEQKGKIFVLGVGQYYDLFFGSNKYWHTPHKIPISGTISYEDNERIFENEPFYIDMETYATFFSLNTEMDDLLKRLDTQNLELKNIKNVLNHRNKKEGNNE